MSKKRKYQIYNARYYEAEIGRFITADNIIPYQLETQSWNRFSYVKNNPVRYKDPSGHFFEELVNWLSGEGWNSNADINIKNNVIDLAYEAIHSDKDIKDFDLKVEKNNKYSVVTALNKGNVTKKIIESNNSNGKNLHFLWGFSKQNTRDTQARPQIGQLFQAEKVKDSMEQTARYAAEKGFKVIFNTEMTYKNVKEAFTDPNSNGVLIATHAYRSNSGESFALSDKSEFSYKDLKKNEMRKILNFSHCIVAMQEMERKCGEIFYLLNQTFGVIKEKVLKVGCHTMTCWKKIKL